MTEQGTVTGAAAELVVAMQLVSVDIVMRKCYENLMPTVEPAVMDSLAREKFKS